MTWKIMEGGTLRGSGLPMRHLQQSVKAEWQGDHEVELSSVRYDATVESARVSWPQSHVTIGPERLSRDAVARYSCR